MTTQLLHQRTTKNSTLRFHLERENKKRSFRFQLLMTKNGTQTLSSGLSFMTPLRLNKESRIDFQVMILEQRSPFWMRTSQVLLDSVTLTLELAKVPQKLRLRLNVLMAAMVQLDA